MVANIRVQFIRVNTIGFDPGIGLLACKRIFGSHNYSDSTTGIPWLDLMMSEARSAIAYTGPCI